MSAGAQTIRTLQIFTKVSQGQGHLIFLQEWQELINMNTYVKYESCITTGAHTIGNYTFLQKKVKGQGQGYLIFSQEWQELININTYVKYESCMSTGAHTIGNYTFLQKKVKFQGHQVKQLIWLKSPCLNECACKI